MKKLSNVRRIKKIGLNSMRKLFPFAWALLLANSIATAQIDLNKSFRGIKKIHVATFLGNCKITKSSSQSVSVVLHHTFNDPRFLTFINQEGSLLVIKETYKGRYRGNATAMWMLTVPDNVTISFSTSSGNFEADELIADMNVFTDSGSIVVNNLVLNGAGNLYTGSGDVEVVLAASPKFNLSLGSGSGKAELNFNGNEIAGEIVMTSGKKNGNISAPFKFDKTEEFGGGSKYDMVMIRQTAVKGSSTSRISINTSSGSAILR